MKKQILLVATVLSSIFIQAQVKEMPTKLDDALLWEISGNGLQKSSYLLGTKHNVEFSFILDSISGIRKVLSSVEQVATEIDMMALDSISREMRSTPDDYFLMPADTTYSMLYDAKDFSFVDSVLSSGNARYAERIPAFWQEIYLNYNLYYNLKQIKKEASMDYYLLLIAHQNSKKTFFLETLEEIAVKKREASSFLYKMNLKAQASDLLFTLKNISMICSVNNRMDSLYRTQKLSKFNFESLIKELAAPYAQITDLNLENNTILNYSSIMIKGRNDAWMLKIPALINQGSTLIAAGAIHLVGKLGLINQLRELGYTVKPMK